MRPSDIASDKYLVAYHAGDTIITLKAFNVSKDDTKTIITTKFGTKTVGNIDIINVEELTDYQTILYREQDEINRLLNKQKKHQYNVTDLYEDANPSFEG